MQKIKKNFHNVTGHLWKVNLSTSNNPLITYQADKLQIIPGEIGATGQSFTGPTLATKENLTLFLQDLIIFVIFPFKLVRVTDVMLLYPNDNLGATQLVAPTCE